MSKGIVASGAELQAAFGTSDESAVCRIILERGALQVGERERDAEYELMFRDVVNLLCEKCVNPTTKRPYTFGVLERAMRDLHVRVDLRRSAKVQSLELVKLINEKSIPIQRARMKLRAEMRTPSSSSASASVAAIASPLSTSPVDTSEHTNGVHGMSALDGEDAGAPDDAHLGAKSNTYKGNGKGKPRRRRRRRKGDDDGDDSDDVIVEDVATGTRGMADIGTGEDDGNIGGKSAKRIPPTASAADVVNFFKREFGVEILVNSRESAMRESEAREGGDGKAIIADGPVAEADPPNDRALGPEGNVVQSEEVLVLVFLIEPGFFRQISHIVQNDLHGRLEVLEIAALEEVDGDAGRANLSMDATAADLAPIDRPMRDVHISRDGRSPKPSAPPTSKLRCTTCQLTFNTPAEHREHFRSDLHKVNVKRKAAGEAPVGADECEAILMMMATESDRRREEMADFM